MGTAVLSESLYNPDYWREMTRPCFFHPSASVSRTNVLWFGS